MTIARETIKLEVQRSNLVKVMRSVKAPAECLTRCITVTNYSHWKLFLDSFLCPYPAMSTGMKSQNWKSSNPNFAKIMEETDGKRDMRKTT